MFKFEIKTGNNEWQVFEDTYTAVTEKGYTGSRDDFYQDINNIIKDINNITKQKDIPDLIPVYSVSGNGLLTDYTDSMIFDILDNNGIVDLKLLITSKISFMRENVETADITIGGKVLPFEAHNRSSLFFDDWDLCNNTYPEYGFDAGDIIEIRLHKNDSEYSARLLTTPYKVMETSSF